MRGGAGEHRVHQRRQLAAVPQALRLVAAFINDATILDVCNGEPCRTP